MSTSHLLELPDDTLAEILELCDIAMLRRLASTSRRLRLLAAPMILSEQKSHLETLVASEMLWLGDEPPDTIQLILNDNITHAPLLCLLIKYDADLCEVLQSLRLLLSHLTSIDRAELVFAVGDPKVAVHRGWMYLLGDVLNLLAEKTTTLGVEGGAGWPTGGLPEVASRLAPPEPETPRTRKSYIRRIASRCARPLTNVLQHLTIGSSRDSTSVDTPPEAVVEEPTTSCDIVLCDIVLELAPRLSITDLESAPRSSSTSPSPPGHSTSSTTRPSSGSASSTLPSQSKSGITSSPRLSTSARSHSSPSEDALRSRPISRSS
ncbi:hypothetical protein LshimejAT787_0701180 [Lyophyllum shimeji]|uniref:F-box domain-containing protein n=1 Tax=Lyophyllum shimeji TaxID=47721 RepID=A0A9P3UNE9_LYOSH|nr:hypothetical protein LshimejAT787_0701180 [Lyophyllum shimeji]